MLGTRYTLSTGLNFLFQSHNLTKLRRKKNNNFPFQKCIAKPVIQHLHKSVPSVSLPLSHYVSLVETLQPTNCWIIINIIERGYRPNTIHNDKSIVTNCDISISISTTKQHNLPSIAFDHLRLCIFI